MFINLNETCWNILYMNLNRSLQNVLQYEVKSNLWRTVHVKLDMNLKNILQSETQIYGIFVVCNSKRTYRIVRKMKLKGTLYIFCI